MYGESSIVYDLRSVTHHNSTAGSTFRRREGFGIWTICWTGRTPCLLSVEVCNRGSVPQHHVYRGSSTSPGEQDLDASGPMELILMGLFGIWFLSCS